ncbi:MAG: hypothetical protein LBC84_02145 [Prevotellaceae bacterium]|jgi:hypothetical protein|nr:hypothetical protein [Prevotellaceae bacterium]
MVHEKRENIIFKIYKNSRSVFTINDIALLMGEEKSSALCKILNYYVKTGKLLNPRKGFYAKEGYKWEELACLLYPPTYISLEYVLQRSGIIFQYDSAITNVSYLTREIEIDNQAFRYRQIKGEILTNTAGIVLNKNNINIATPERAFLDTLYLYKKFYFDYPYSLDKKKIMKLLPLYNSQTLVLYVKKLLSL